MVSITKTDSEERTIPKISLHDFANRRAEIKAELIDAAENTGFFVLVNQQSPSAEEIEEMFELSTRFFKLPHSAKACTPFIPQENNGWEHKSQIRPSTGLADEKESLQLQFHRRNDGRSWPSDSALGAEFQDKLAGFMEKTNALSQEILSFFAEALGFPSDFFKHAHQVESPQAQNTLRLLHYPAAEGQTYSPGTWRAGAHTDFDCLTLLFQRTGEAGLEICPGRECHTSFGIGDKWTPLEPRTGEIVCNIGDMLMAWSDDRFKSLFHRVRCPGPGDTQGDRYSIAYFNQANKDVVIQGPLGKYPPMTAQKYILDAMSRNFGQLQKRLQGEREREEREQAAIPVSAQPAAQTA